jgi:protoheme IX farnesyltransferase
VQVLKDFGNLIKFKVNVVVVLTSILGYFMASKGQNVQVSELLGLSFGGFFTTGAAHAINQIIERKYDALMDRTKDRPLPSKRMSIVQVAIYALLMTLTGYFSFSIFNNGLTLFLGMISMLIYSFLYTPLKRIGPVAVAVGAIPGALPPAIGYIAYTGVVDKMSILLFMIQFIWQFPHFWSIAWLYFDDYSKGGYELMPSKTGRSEKNAFFTFISSLVLIPFIIMLYTLNLINIYWIIPMIFITFFFVYKAFMFYKKPDRLMARNLMLSSIIYLPVLQIMMILAMWNFF